MMNKELKEYFSFIPKAGKPKIDRLHNLILDLFPNVLSGLTMSPLEAVK